MTKPVPIGTCIYCLKSGVELTDEHIVPYGFGNTVGDILYEASCKSCASITSNFELIMLRKNFLPIRSVLQFPSRKNKTYKTMKQTVKYINGTVTEIEVPFDKFLGQFALPIFQPPSCLIGNFTKQLLTVEEMRTFVIGNVSNKQWYEERGIEEHFVHFIKSNKGQAYARFIMKIAYCAAVKFEGLNAVKESPVRDLILGNDRHFAVYFGNMDDSQFAEPPTPNTVARYAVVSIDNSSKKLAAVQIFPFLEGSPVYHTII